MGPGFITGASDDDPSAIATYSQTSAQFGYNQAWAALLTLPFMIAIQEISTRIGLVSGKGIACLLKEQYPKYIIIFIISLFFMANVINIAANLSAMAVSIQLSINIPFYLLIIFFAVFILVLEIFIQCILSWTITIIMLVSTIIL